MDDLLTEYDKGQELYADSAYVGLEETLEKYGVKDRICERGYRGHPLTEEQKESNRVKSKTRSRVEHVFGFMECVMNKLYVRTIGLARAASTTGMFNLVYNMCRYEQIVRYIIKIGCKITHFSDILRRLDDFFSAVHLHRQFEKIAGLTYDFLYKELEKMCYGKILDLTIKKECSGTIGGLLDSED